MQRDGFGFSALQRAEIAEISCTYPHRKHTAAVSVLFNEPKLLKFQIAPEMGWSSGSFSALQRAENSSIERR